MSLFAEREEMRTDPARFRNQDQSASYRAGEFATRLAFPAISGQFADKLRYRDPNLRHWKVN